MHGALASQIDRHLCREPHKRLAGAHRRERRGSGEAAAASKKAAASNGAGPTAERGKGGRWARKHTGARPLQRWAVARGDRARAPTPALLLTCCSGGRRHVASSRRQKERRVGRLQQ
eukprot:1213492-Prymnesium_polylepis.1